MDMSGSVGARLVTSSDTREGDVVADDVLCHIDPVLEEAAGSLLARSATVLGVDDLVGSGLDEILGVEVEDLLILLEVVVLPLVVPVKLPVLKVGDFANNAGNEVTKSLRFGSGSGYSECSTEKSNGGYGEMHGEWMFWFGETMDCSD
jgi:hypothetical protein